MGFQKILLAGILTWAGITGQAQIEKSLKEGNAQFAITFYKQWIKENPKANLCFSPYSISQALAMTYCGAKNTTQKEMAQVMYFDKNPHLTGSDFQTLNSELKKQTDSVNFSLANALWAHKGYLFLPSYFQQMETYFNAPLYYANFEKTRGRKKASKKINNWVYNQTNSQIKNLISPNNLTSDTRLILVNALYFFAEWQHAFDAANTKNNSFFGWNETLQLPFMETIQKIPYYSDDLVHAISLPYKGNKQSLMVLLPNKTDGLSKLEETFDYFYFSTILSDFNQAQATIIIPQFELETTNELSGTMKNMGLNIAFSNEADFSGMTGATDLRIDKIFHKTKLKISEQGTEAAAASAVVMVRKSAAAKPVIFEANHPFMYFIFDNQTQTILFMGRFAGN